jgi:hypothetical protein
LALMRKPEDAPADLDVIGIDNHGFCGRYRRKKNGGWVPFGRNAPLFDDGDMAGWVSLPVEGVDTEFKPITEWKLAELIEAAHERGTGIDPIFDEMLRRLEMQSN